MLNFAAFNVLVKNKGGVKSNEKETNTRNSPGLVTRKEPRSALCQSRISKEGGHQVPTIRSPYLEVGLGEIPAFLRFDMRQKFLVSTANTNVRHPVRMPAKPAVATKVARLPLLCPTLS
jgi:hypothetical protein